MAGEVGFAGLGVADYHCWKKGAGGIEMNMFLELVLLIGGYAALAFAVDWAMRRIDGEKRKR